MLNVAVNLTLLNINSVSKIAFQLLHLGYYVRDTQMSAVVDIQNCNTLREEFRGLR
jgi:hypothetical protein